MTTDRNHYLSPIGSIVQLRTDVGTESTRSEVRAYFLEAKNVWPKQQRNKGSFDYAWKRRSAQDDARTLIYRSAAHLRMTQEVDQQI